METQPVKLSEFAAYPPTTTKSGRFVVRSGDHFMKFTFGYGCAWAVCTTKENVTRFELESDADAAARLAHVGGYRVEG